MTVRRLKTYTGSQGYVYQYYFVGQRRAAGSNATEYVFDVTSDRKTTYAVTIALPDEVVSGWNESHGRALTGSEQYAAVKMRLFQAFDEFENMSALGRSLQVDRQGMEESLASLHVD